MDAIDILGGLLGRKSRSNDKGGDVLKDIFGRGPSSSRQSSGTERPPSQQDISQEAKELEDMLNVAKERDPWSGSSSSGPARSSHSTGGEEFWPDSPFTKSQRQQTRPPASKELTRNDQAIVLIRAMLNASKADGQISREEQQQILSQMDDRSSSARQFLQEELNKPLNVREFAWSVPVGMEEQVYGISLMAIRVDSAAERKYLDELAHGLRLSLRSIEQLHRRYRQS